MSRRLLPNSTPLRLPTPTTPQVALHYYDPVSRRRVLRVASRRLGVVAALPPFLAAVNPAAAAALVGKRAAAEAKKAGAWRWAREAEEIGARDAVARWRCVYCCRKSKGWCTARRFAGRAQMGLCYRIQSMLGSMPQPPGSQAPCCAGRPPSLPLCRDWRRLEEARLALGATLGLVAARCGKEVAVSGGGHKWCRQAGSGTSRSFVKLQCDGCVAGRAVAGCWSAPGLSRNAPGCLPMLQFSRVIRIKKPF